ncbi:MAG TPA: recombinase family protein [Symbiobacteriaceae bacterium]|nr:recombinase family protein [Symbiobacteriaceae bacterium]
MPAYKEIRPNAVAIYIRWSTDEQTEGTTLETQKERCSLYLRSQGWNVTDEFIFIDDGYSGGSLDRPALSRLRQMVREGRVDCVVTYSLDRLSRSVADTVTLVQSEWLAKCVYRSASQPISTDDGNPTGQLIFNILASFAEFERALIRERTHSGHVRRAKEGKYPGGKKPPYGYRRDGKGSLVIDSVGEDGTLQGAAAVVRQMFEMATTGPLGQGPSVIARALVEEGAPSPTGGPWWMHVVARILQNPVYCGHLVYGRLPVNPAHRRDKTAPHRLRGQKPLVELEGVVPAIVEVETWNKAQQLFRERSQICRKGLQSRNRSLLTSIARCKCGGPLSVFYDRVKTRYYRCTRNFQSADGCGYVPGMLNADKMEQAVVKAIKERYGSPELRRAAVIMAKAERESGEHQANCQRAITEIDRRLQEIDADLARVRRAARRGEIQLATFEELRIDAETERQELQAERAEREKALEQVRTIETSLSDWEALMVQVDMWDDLEVNSQRDILYGLLRSITMYRQKGSNDAPEIDLVWETP